MYDRLVSLESKKGFPAYLDDVIVAKEDALQARDFPCQSIKGRTLCGSAEDAGRSF
jgi:hypothetical protein